MQEGGREKYQKIDEGMGDMTEEGLKRTVLFINI
jgi:hypothetical protein